MGSAREWLPSKRLGRNQPGGSRDMGSKHKAERLKEKQCNQKPFKDVSHFFKADNEMSKGVKTLLEQ